MAGAAFGHQRLDVGEACPGVGSGYKAAQGGVAFFCVNVQMLESSENGRGVMGYRVSEVDMRKG